MTRRLYYEDPYLTEFDAHVVEHLTWQNAPAVILDRTAFYPEGGGQPADRGWLNDVAVLDVQTRAEDHTIIHILEHPLESSHVHGRVDWTRRFDHMQQHTAQHILSQTFLRLFQAHTVGFHLGERYTTVDLDRGDISPEDVIRAETLANHIIEENLPVTARFVPPQLLDTLALRKPPKVQGPVRLVYIGDFDVVPCGGTHVAHTGEIGLLAVVRAERYKGGVRLTLLAGRRARADYRRRRELLHGLSNLLTCGEEELFPRVERLLQELRTLQEERRAWRERLIHQKARALLQHAIPLGPWHVIRSVVEDLSGEEVRKLAAELRNREDTILLLGWREENNARVLFAAPKHTPLHMGHLVREALAPVHGRGGGRPEWAEGGIPSARDLPGALDRALKILRQHGEELV